MLLPQHPGALDTSAATTSKHVGIFQLLRSSVGSLISFFFFNVRAGSSGV